MNLESFQDKFKKVKNKKKLVFCLFVKYNKVDSLKEKTEILIDKITWQW